MRIGKELSTGAAFCLDILDDVILQIKHLTYMTNAAILSFTLTNTKSKSTLVDIEIDGDIFLRRADDAPVASIPGRRGILVYTLQHALTFLLRSSPVVTDVSSYWFGNPEDIPEHFWTQTTSDLYYGDDSGLVFSWQNISLAPYATVTKAAVVKFALPDGNQLNLTLNVTAVPSTLDVNEEVDLLGVVTSADPGAEIYLLILVDPDVSKGWRLQTWASPGEPFDFMFKPASYGVSAGLHTFSIYALDDQGTLSAPAKITVTVLARTRSPAQSPVATRTPQPTRTKSATRTPSRSRPPAPTLPPSPPPLPIRVTPGELDDFEITGVSHQFFEVHFSGNGLGFTTGLKIGTSLSETAVGCRPYHFQNVALFTEFVNLSTNAVLVVLRLQNDNNHNVVVSLESDSGTLLNYDDAASIAALSGGRGVVVYSFKYALTIIGRGAPLVTNATAFWFGNLLEMILQQEYFSQTHDTVYFGDEGGLAFSWHNISLAPGASTTKTFAIKWGLPDINTLHLALNAAPQDIGKLAVIRLSGKVTSHKANELISIFVVVDGDFSNIHRVAANLSVNATIEFAIDLSTFGLKPGSHEFTISAVDSLGTFSNGVVIRGTAPAAASSKKKAIAIGVGVSVGFVVIVVVVIVVVCFVRNRSSPGLSKREMLK
jgi:hypothetical protein